MKMMVFRLVTGLVTGRIRLVTGLVNWRGHFPVAWSLLGHWAPFFSWLFRPDWPMVLGPKQSLLCMSPSGGCMEGAGCPAKSD